jgi:RNA polymerase sigma factor (sigma-70 family)
MAKAPANPEVGETVFLIRRARDGDREAQDRLFGRFAPYVRKVVLLRVGGSPARSEDVDDLVQDALLRAVEGIERFGGRPEDDFKAWLACCARCAVFDDYKRANALKRGGGKAVRNFTDWGSSYLTSSIFASKEPTPSNIVRQREVEEKIYDALLQLEDRHRKIIIYRKLVGMEYIEIVRILKLRTVEKARVLCHRALEKLAEALRAGGVTAD